MLLKTTETADELTIEPARWEFTYVDPQGIEHGIEDRRAALHPSPGPSLVAGVQNRIGLCLSAPGYEPDQRPVLVPA